MTTQADVEGEHMHYQTDVEGEHQTMNPLVEGEPSGSNHDEGNVIDNDFHDFANNISISGEVSDVEGISKDAQLEFDLAYPPMDKWTHNHLKEQIPSDPNSGILTRSQFSAKNKVLNIH